VGDYRKDTGHLTTLEHGIYRQLLDWYYLDETPIPKETQTVIRRLRLGSDADIQSLQNVLNDFFVLQDDGYHQGHCDVVIAKYHENAEKNKVNGKLGGRPKKTQSVILGNPTETESKGNHQPITINQKPNKKATVVATPEGVSQSVWDEFIAHRKSKKAKVTDLVIEGIAKEASKAEWSLEDALKETIVRNWQSFKADWVAVKPQMQNKWDVAGITTPPPPNQDAALRKIEEDSKRAAKPSLEVLAKMAELRKKVAQ
jgi:uncharacterized protein YdaU (DUF1376 family)